MMILNRNPEPIRHLKQAGLVEGHVLQLCGLWNCVELVRVHVVVGWMVDLMSAHYGDAQQLLLNDGVLPEGWE